MSGTLQVGGVTLATHTESPSTLTLDSGVVFPVGHLIKAQLDVYSTNNEANSATYVTAVQSGGYSIQKTGSTIYIDGHFQWRALDAKSIIKIEWSDDNFSTTNIISTSADRGVGANTSDIIWLLVPFHEKITHGKNASDEIKFRVSCNRESGSGIIQLNINDSARIRILEVV